MHPLHLVSVDKYSVRKLSGRRLVGTVFHYADNGHRLLFAVDEKQLLAYSFFGIPAHTTGCALHDVHLTVFRLGRYPFTRQQLHVVKAEELFTRQHFVKGQGLLQPAFHACISIYQVRRISPFAQQRPIGRTYHFRHHRQGLDFLGPYVHVHIHPNADGCPSAIVHACIHIPQMVQLQLHSHRTEDESHTDCQLKNDTSLPPSDTRKRIARMHISMQ